MKILKLDAENVKRLKAVHIEPDGSLVVIRGDNAQGKTSVLDAIMLALGGKAVSPPKVVREGEAKARVTLELGDLTVERRWTAAGGTSLEVRSKDGVKYASPQAMLDKLVGSLSFDPLAFTRMKPADQAEQLRQVAGVDVSAFEEMAEKTFSDRTVVNREVAQLEARLASMPQAPGKYERVNASELVAELERLHAQQVARDRAASQKAHAEAKFKEAMTAQTDAEAAVERARQALAAARDRATAAGEAAIAATHAAGEAVDQSAAIAEVKTKLASAESTNAAVRTAEERAKVAGALAYARAQSESLTGMLAQLDTEKKAALDAAQFPVPGLSFTPAGVTLNGLPLEQASGAEALRVSLAVAIALNPKLKVIRITDGSLLDKRSLAMVAEMAEASGHQVWLEMVGKDGMGVVIEDGSVEEVRS